MSNSNAPNLAIGVIVKQTPSLVQVGLTSPDDRSGIDVGRIVNPFLVWSVTRDVAD
jgi:hypothetical protein